MDKNKVLDLCDKLMGDIGCTLKEFSKDFVESDDFKKDNGSMGEEQMAELMVGSFLRNMVREMGIPEYNFKSDSLTWR